MSARVGDFIIKGVGGEFYPYKPEIFAKTYEEIIEIDLEMQPQEYEDEIRKYEEWGKEEKTPPPYIYTGPPIRAKLK